MARDSLNNSVSALDCGVFLNHEADLQAWRVKSKIDDKESGTPRNPQRARPAAHQNGVGEFEKAPSFRCIRRLVLTRCRTRAELCRVIQRVPSAIKQISAINTPHSEEALTRSTVNTGYAAIPVAAKAVLNG